jgi:hypothetical protein
MGFRVDENQYVHSIGQKRGHVNKGRQLQLTFARNTL